MAAAGVYHEELEALRHQSGCAAALIALAICFAVPRLIAQSLRNSQLAVHSWDVGLILASAIVFITLCAFAIGEYHKEFKGKLCLLYDLLVNAQAYSAFYEAHDKATKGHHYVTVFKTSYAISVIYPLASAIPKLSLCAFYLQVMGVNTWVRRITNSTGAFLVANAVAWLVPTIIVCRPISVFWSLEGHQGKCLNYNVFGTWISLPNIITDLVLLILPMPVLWKTQISILRKLGLMAIFAVGCAGTIGACFRMAFYIHRTYVERQGTKQTTSKHFDIQPYHHILTFSRVDCAQHDRHPSRMRPLPHRRLHAVPPNRLRAVTQKPQQQHQLPLTKTTGAPTQQRQQPQ